MSTDVPSLDNSANANVANANVANANVSAVDTILPALTAVLEQRRQHAAADSSYVAKLHSDGIDKILKKVGEECAETIIAAKDAARSGDNQPLIFETADLWFHTLVMLSHVGEDYRAVLRELERRFDLSGLAEKAARKS